MSTSQPSTIESQPSTQPYWHNPVDEQCPDCDSDCMEFTHEFDARGYPILACQRCSHAFVFIPPPDVLDLADQIDELTTLNADDPV